MLPLVMGSDECLMPEARGSLEKYIDSLALYFLGYSVKFCRLKMRTPPPPLCIHPSFTQQSIIPYTLPSARLCARVRVIMLSNTWLLPFRSLSQLERNFKDFLCFLFPDCSSYLVYIFLLILQSLATSHHRGWTKLAVYCLLSRNTLPILSTSTYSSWKTGVSSPRHCSLAWLLKSWQVRLHCRFLCVCLPMEQSL